MALGAESPDILKMVFREGVRLGGLGVALGIPLAYAAGRSLQTLLAGVAPTDALVFASAIALVAIMSIAGSLIPAWRAIRVDPIEVIRAE